MLKADKKDHLLYEVDEATGELIGPACEECSVRKRATDLINGNITLWMELWVRDTRKYFPMDRHKLFNGGFVDVLADQGLTPPDDISDIREHLIESDIAAGDVWTHSKLGFHEISISEDEKKLVFLADTVIGDSGRDSHYYQPAVTAPKGTLASWQEFIKQEVISHPYLEMAVAISVSAPIVHILRMKGIYTENPVWTLIGKSSSGKTSTLRIIASVYGSPAEDSGLIGSLHTTEAALYIRFSNKIGVPNIIDEATSQPDWDFAPATYNFSKGRTKDKCEGRDRLAAQLQFSGPIIISSERSLFEQSRAEGGMFARMVEFNNIPWTSSPEHADRILVKSHQNYGTAVEPIAKMMLNILDKGSDILEKMFCKELSFFRVNLPNASGEEQRLLKMYATVVVAAQVANTALKISLDVDGLRHLFIQLHSTVPKARNLAEDLYNKVVDEVNQHGGNFSRRSEKNGAVKFSSNTWGEFSTYHGKKVIWMTGETFKKFAQPFSNYKSLLPDLHAQGLIVKFSDRYLTDHNLGYGTVKCYCLIEK